MDSYEQYGVQGGSTTLAECAAAVKELDGKQGCRGRYFFFEESGYCNCPTDDCTDAINSNAGGPGQLYEFRTGDCSFSGFGECKSSLCTSSGNDCFAPDNEVATCSGGYVPLYTDTGGSYKCCALSGVPSNYQCDASYCTSMGDDCYAPGTEAATCSGGYEPFYTDTAGNYKCCALSSVPSNYQCDAYSIAQALPTTAMPQAPRPRLALEDMNRFTRIRPVTTNAVR